MKKIDISKLEKLAKKNQERPVENMQVSFEGTGQGGFYISEKTEDSAILTIVGKRNFKTVDVIKEIKNLKENTTESYIYSPKGLLETYKKIKNSTKLKDAEIGEIHVQNYVELLEKYDDKGILKFRRNYDEYFKINLKDIIKIAKDSNYKNVGIFKIFLDENFAEISTFGITTESISTERPYWVISFQDVAVQNGGTNLVFRVFDGISGEFIKEQKTTIFTGMDHNQ